MTYFPPMAPLSGARLRAHDQGSFLGHRIRHGLSLGLIGLLGLLGLLATAPPAYAHGGDESKEGYILVQQALGHLAHDTSMTGIDLAMEKVDDALAAEDQDGVDVAKVEQAKKALGAGHAVQARTLLQGSIKEALAELTPAMGEQTGTTVVAPELPGRQNLTGRDWGFLAVSLILLLVGVGLAFLFRPSDSVRDLRGRLGPRTAVPRSASGPA